MPEFIKVDEVEDKVKVDEMIENGWVLLSSCPNDKSASKKEHPFIYSLGLVKPIIIKTEEELAREQEQQEKEDSEELRNAPICASPFNL